MTKANQYDRNNGASPHAEKADDVAALSSIQSSCGQGNKVVPDKPNKKANMDLYEVPVRRPPLKYIPT